MNNIEGFILAGGASRRMGRDKAQLRLKNKTFIEHAANALYKITGGKISIVGNLPFENLQVNLSSDETCELPVLPDIQTKNSRASLVGLYSALAQAKEKWSVVLACDLPFVTGDLLERLVSFVSEKDFDAVVPLQRDGRPQPLCAFYKCAVCLPKIEEILRGEDWSLQNLLRRINTRFVEFSEISDLPNSEHFFLNINTPEDFEAAWKIKEGMKDEG
ncbi:MAG TPA: molybdenum cofactor guanylyltransferase [Pyrinomonadaceae bacterium]|nr:molybdenum cofactor guanylyltransferase [Pyrinomonadaceae bacterium]